MACWSTQLEGLLSRKKREERGKKVIRKWRHLLLLQNVWLLTDSPLADFQSRSHFSSVLSLSLHSDWQYVSTPLPWSSGNSNFSPPPELRSLKDLTESSYSCLLPFPFLPAVCYGLGLTIPSFLKLRFMGPARSHPASKLLLRLRDRINGHSLIAFLS